MAIIYIGSCRVSDGLLST